MTLNAISLFILAAAVVAQSSFPKLPASALEAADRSALSVATAIAGRGIPAGVVTTDNPSQVVPVNGDESAPLTATLDDVLDRFRRRHTDYTATVADGVLHLDLTGTACGRTVETTKLKANSVQTDAIRLIIIVSWMASGDPPPIPAGTIGLLGRHEGDPLPLQLPLTPINLVIAEGTTLRAAFDEIVRRNKGGVWIVWQHTRDDGATGCRAVVYHSNGQVAAATKDFAVAK